MRALLCLLVISSSPAWASLARIGIEPYLGYSEFKFDAGGDSDTKYGAVLGGKGGLEFANEFYFALDYHMGGPYILENNEDNEYLNHMWGLGIGVRKTNWRFWVGHYFDVVLDDINRNFIYEGTAFKFSLGYVYKTKISFNVEYCMQDYSKIRNEPDVPFSLDVSVLFVSISAPLYLN